MKEQKLEYLVCHAKRREPDAFTTLIDLQMQGLYKVAWSILQNEEDSADAIQETILTCWEKIETLKVNQYFKTWITRILINKCYRILKNKQNVTYMDEVPEIPTGFAEYSFEWEEALSALSEKYRIVVILFYAQGFRTKEIARILGIPDNTVRTRLVRARQQLEEYYKE